MAAADGANATHTTASLGQVCDCHHRPAVFLLFAFISGILVCRLIPGYSVAGWIIAVAAAARLVLLLRWQKPAVLAPLALFGALGYLAISPLVIPEFPPDSVLPYLDGKNYRISGIIAAPPLSEPFRTKCILSNLHVLRNHQEEEGIAVPGRIRAIFYGSAPGVFPGDRLVFSGKIRPPKNFCNPGGFDYKQFMAFQQVWGTVYANKDGIEIQPGPSGKLNRTVYKARQAVDAAIANVSKGDRRAVLTALIIGKTEYLSRELRAAFSHAGASHLLAISGLHVGIIATCSLFLLKGLLGGFPFLLRRGWVRKAAALLSIAPVIGYGLISGMSPSTQRAVIMICMALSAFLIDRDYDPANTLASAAAAILIVSPQSLFSISFQLSFAAVTAIMTGFGFLPGLSGFQGNSVKLRLRKTVVVFSAVSVFAIAGTAPLVMHYFNQFTILGIVSNLVLIPLIGFVVVPLGLAATLLYPISEPLALLGYALADRLIGAGLEVIRLLARFPIGTFRTVTPSILELGCIYVLLFGLPMLWRFKRSKPYSEEEQSVRSLSAAPAQGSRGAASAIAGMVIIATALLVIDAGYWIYRRYLNTAFRITMLDVGQGNAAVLELPRGKIMLIDGGGFSNNDIFDVGAMILSPYLSNRKIRTIDTIILSHADADHLNGLVHILEHFNVRSVISTQLPAESAEYRQFIQTIESKGISHPPWKDVGRRFELNGVAFELLHPPPILSEFAGISRNQNSIVTKATYNGVSVLFPGDIESAAESELVAREGEKLTAALLLSPHHGSRTSSTPAFLDAVKPETIVISVRKDRFGLPSATVLDRYARLGCGIFRTDLHGAVRITIDEKGFRIRPTLPAEKESPERTTSNASLRTGL